MCGGVRFELSEPLLGALFCHCKRCQRRTGTGVSTTALTAPGSYRTVAGEELIGRWDPGDGGYVKVFCTRCGSQLFTTNPENPESSRSAWVRSTTIPASGPAPTSSSPTRLPGTRCPTTGCRGSRSASTLGQRRPIPRPRPKRGAG